MEDHINKAVGFACCFVGFDALISGSNWKNIFVLDISFIEEGYRLYNITLQPIGAE